MDAASHLATITDASGNMTSLARDATGNLTSITSPFGQKTIFATGYITRITNPNQESVSFTYGTGGLLSTMTDALGNVDKFQYDSMGLLTHSDHPGGASEDLVRNSTDGSIQLTTAAGVTTNYATDLSTPGTEARAITYASGVQRKITSSATFLSSTLPNGTDLEMTFVPDPRWGTQAPVIAGSSVTTPGGSQVTATEERTVTLSNTADPFSVSSAVETFTINGRARKASYDAATRTLSMLSAAGRTGSTILDASGRIISQQVGSLDPTGFTYDTHGRLSSIILGSGSASETTSLLYNTQGYLASITDAVKRVLGFEYDGAGRVTKRNLPQGTSIVYGYDANNDLKSLTPPGGSTHTLTYVAPSRLVKYSPPAINGVNAETSFSYDADASVRIKSDPPVLFRNDPGRREARRLG